MTGTVKYFDATKGFGHIMADDKGPDVFVHQTDLSEGMKLHTGMEVEFDLHPTYRHPKSGTRRVIQGSVRLLNRRAYVPINEGRKAAKYGD